MAQPPRLDAVSLPWDQPVIYFVTLCVADRPLVLAEPRVFAAVKEVSEQLRSWTLRAGVLMPDHAHFVVSPISNRDLSVGDFSNGFKRLLRQRLPHEWQWQRGCFDRLLRSDESLSEKWDYVRENPVRAGLVERAEDWLYFFGETTQIHGKLAASPTRAGAAAFRSVGEAVSFPRVIAGENRKGSAAPP